MTLRVGVIGVGWGSHVQVPGFRAADGYEPVALCARNPERLQRVAGKVGIADTSTDWETFVSRDDLDVISIATPTVLHHEMTLAALETGKAVLCEKPLAADLDSARDMVRAAEKSGRPTACCFETVGTQIGWRWPRRSAPAFSARPMSRGSAAARRTGIRAAPRRPVGCMTERKVAATSQGCWSTTSTFCAAYSAGRKRCAPKCAAVNRAAPCPTARRST